MAEAVGQSGRVTGLEISDSMLALSRRRCADPSVRGQVAFVKADAVALPFPDGMFDAAVSTQVYEYIADLKTALTELHRVLRPGGRALIIDTDWDSIVWNAADQERMQKLLNAWTKRFADPYLPRTLARQLQDAGLHVRHRDVLVLFNPEHDPDTFSVRNGEIMADYAIAQHAMTRDDAQAWMQDLQQLGRDGRYFFSLNRYLFMATKQT
jgi:arsenite methyltransferase